ncbi:hypothetical protein [Streptomyces bauhiniae]
MKRNAAVAVAGAVLVGALVTGCDTGPECLRDHLETSYGMVWNGKTMVPHTVYTVVCDEYAKEPPK